MSRLTDREIANVDHLLHFAFAFGDDLSGLQGYELAELVFQFAQRIAKATNSLAAHGPGVARHFRNASCARVIAF